MSYLLLRDVSDQRVINTALETPVFNMTVPAGVWPGNVLLIEQTGRFNNGAASSRTYVMRLRLNGNVITVGQPPNSTNSASYYAATQRWFLAAPSTSEIHAVFRWSSGGAGSDTGAFVLPTAPSGGASMRYGDKNMLKTDPGYIDLGKPVQLELTIQLSAAAAAYEFTSMGVFVGLLGDAITPGVRPQPIGKVGA